MSSISLDTIKNDPQFQSLVSKRSRFAWTLTAAILIIYFGFISVIAFAPKVLAIPLGTGIVATVGIPIGLGVIVSAFALTGIYVARANTEFDALTQQIVERMK